jgi:hypothetical protein
MKEIDKDPQKMERYPVFRDCKNQYCENVHIN